MVLGTLFFKFFSSGVFTTFLHKVSPRGKQRPATAVHGYGPKDLPGSRGRGGELRIFYSIIGVIDTDGCPQMSINVR